MVSIALPRIQANPSQDFLYLRCSDRDWCLNRYQIIDGKLTAVNDGADKVDPADPIVYPWRDGIRPAPPIYRYSLDSKQSTRITLEETSHLTINNSAKSSEGYTLEIYTANRTKNYGSKIRHWVIKKGGAFKSTDVQLDSDNKEDLSVTLLGWIKE